MTHQEILAQFGPRESMEYDVVIVGAGFGGLEVAHRLAGAPVRITIVDQRNHHLFQPLLYQVATASLATSEIAWPIRHLVCARPRDFRRRWCFRSSSGNRGVVNGAPVSGPILPDATARISRA